MYSLWMDPIEAKHAKKNEDIVGKSDKTKFVPDDNGNNILKTQAIFKTYCLQTRPNCRSFLKVFILAISLPPVQ